MYKKILILTLMLMGTAACTSGRDQLCSGNTLKRCEPTIYFDFNSAKLGPDGAQKLNWPIEKLKRWKDRTVVLTGYTDLSGSAEYNRRLSLKRAEAAKRYLIRRGIDADRIQVIGQGKEKPLFTTKEGQELNRRVEVTFGHKDRLFFLDPDRLCEDCCSDL